MSKSISDIINLNEQWHKSIENLLEKYKYIYGLSIIKKTKLITNSFYNYCLKGKYFVVIALYNSKKEFFVQKDLLEDDNKLDLVGGWVKDGESFDQALERIVDKETGNKLVESMPVALVNNFYHTKDNKKISHQGIAFLGRVLHDSVSTQNGIFTSNQNAFLSDRDLEILRLCKKILNEKIIDPPLDEVDENFNGKHLIKFNNKIIKPLIYLFSSRILSNCILEHITYENTKKIGYVLDVSCGDDKSILKIAQKSRLLVANDISRSKMEPLIYAYENKNIIFTNQNLLDLSYKIKFDIVICKNTMHHMKTPEEIELLIDVLKRYSKNRIILMDIEDPQKSILAKAWNMYYRKIMDDHGGLFITFNQFKEIIRLKFPNASNILNKRVRTIKGQYMVSIIDL